MAGGKKNQAPAVCHGHSRPIVEVNYSPVTSDGYFLVSASKDGMPMLRDGPTGDWIGTFQGHKGAVWSCVINDEGHRAATGSADFSATYWDALSGLPLHTFQHKHIVRCVAFAHHSPKLATGGMEKLLRIFDLERPDAEPEKSGAAAGGLRSVHWVAQDSLIVTACNDQPGIGVWDTRTMAQVRTLPTDAPVTSIDATFCGRFLTTTDGQNIRFWDTSSLSCIKSVAVDYPVETASFCPAKGKFVGGGADMWVRLHRWEDGVELECGKGHHGPIRTVKFGPEGREYATGSEDGTIRIWQTDFLEMQQQQDGGGGGGAVANGSNGSAAGG